MTDRKRERDTERIVNSKDRHTERGTMLRKTGRKKGQGIERERKREGVDREKDRERARGRD